MITIVPYTEATRHFVKELNYEWLEKYFSVEPNDELQLSDPQKYIIDKGGLIFYAFYNNEIAGTFSLLRVDEQTYELGKMATTAAFQGKGIGNAMLEFCIATAREMHVKKLILFSNTKLENAIHLYKKFGFYEVQLDKTLYKRSDIKMEKNLEEIN